MNKASNLKINPVLQGSSVAIKEISRLIALSGQGARGYGGKLEAAKLCNDTFGKGWIEPSPITNIDKLSRKLIHEIFKDAVGGEHSNVSVIWRKFQDSAKADNLVERELGVRKRSATLKVIK